MGVLAENRSVEQRPGSTHAAHGTDDLVEAVHAAGRHRRVVAVQATGHGAGRPLGAETLLVDTSGLDHVVVDPRRRTATVGAGARWRQVQAAAQRHGLLGLSGTAPGVGVAGYTFGGGVGWFVRPHGLASNRLRSVEFVDGTGRIRTAQEEATDPADREALWAFRGGAPVGLASSITIDLVDATDLWAGCLLWDAEDLPGLAAAWAGVVDGLAPEVTSTLAVVALPPRGPFPAQLLGRAAVHLSYASAAGRAPLVPLLEALRSVAPPVYDVTEPADAERLAAIHLDPPVPVAAVGTGRWLGEGAATLLTELVEAARIGRGGLTMLEVRHVASTADAAAGALTVPPAPYLLHAVGQAGDPDQRTGTLHRLSAVEIAAAAVDTGRAAVNFLDGRPDPADAYPAGLAARISAIRDQLDPHHLLRPERPPWHPDPARSRP